MFYSKVIATSVNTFIPLGDETINSSLVERGRSLMYPQPHPLLHFLVRMKQTSPNVLIQVAKNVEVTRGKIWVYGGYWNISQPDLWSLGYPSPGWQYGDRHYRAKGWFCLTAFQGILTLWNVSAPSATKKWTTPLCSSLLASISSAGRTHFTLHSPPAFWLYGTFQHPQLPRNEPHLSALLCLSPFPMLDEHTLHYTHLQHFDFMERFSTLSFQEMNHTSLLIFTCLYFQCWMNTLYTTLTSRAIKE